MKRIVSILTVIALTTLLSSPRLMAGNDDRRGTPGASELLINPWARSSSWGGINTSCARGIDAFFSNIAGLAFVEKTEFVYTNTMWLGGKSGLRSGASINSFGLAVRLGDASVLGAYVMAMGFGDLDRTTEVNPEPGSNGTFSPSVMNLNVGFAHSFTNSIHGGAVLKVITESTDNVTATGVAIDAGIQYMTGANDEIKFGIALKNIGPAMSFSGTGMSFTTVNDAGNNMTVELRSAEMELPTCLNIGASYDFFFEKWDQRLTVAANFTSNAFLRDNFGAPQTLHCSRCLRLPAWPVHRRRSRYRQCGPLRRRLGRIPAQERRLFRHLSRLCLPQLLQPERQPLHRRHHQVLTAIGNIKTLIRKGLF